VRPGTTTAAPTSGGSAAPAAPRAPILGAQFVGPNTYLGPIPTFTLILTSADPARNAKVCAGFQSEPTLAAAQAANPFAVVSPLRWVLTATAGVDTSQCTDLLAHYDFYRAGSLLGAVVAATVDAEGQAADISGKGPYLLEQYADGGGVHYALVDFSKTTDAQFAGFSALVNTALAEQAEFLSSNKPVSAAVQAATTPATVAAAQAAKSNMPAWLQTACGFATSPVTKLFETILTTVFAPATAVVTPLETVVNAGCGSGSQTGAAPAAATKPAPATKGGGGKKI